MAGIAGVLGEDSGELEQMLAKISYRGPHQTWLNIEEHVLTKQFNQVSPSVSKTSVVERGLTTFSIPFAMSRER